MNEKDDKNKLRSGVIANTSPRFATALDEHLVLFDGGGHAQVKLRAPGAWQYVRPEGSTAHEQRLLAVMLRQHGVNGIRCLKRLI